MTEEDDGKYIRTTAVDYLNGLNLSSSNLTGEVARALMDLTELTSLDLSHNQLTGQIPDLFDQMPKLKILYDI
ncbi:hypothetical protein SAY87_017286 [Trapa incisa]|uniref:Uncharacterized protein n=1 Tax=Trapa incisa TaxID=236973 RepID=A0AAN7LHH9_9MYRT|nr:hypothetical protein SAY87_017286 [Trapa incisa]